MASYSVLIDTGTDTVLAVNWHAAAIQFVHECTMDTEHIAAANLPNYQREFSLARVPPRELPQWTWVSQTRMFTETRSDVVTDEMRARAELANAKARAISFMIHRINYNRNHVRTGLDFQELVYLAKEMQARKLKESGFDERLIIGSPYVVHYADALDIPLEKAVEQILLQAKLDHEFLARSEKVRILNFDRIKKASTPEEVQHILHLFKRIV